MNKFYKKILFYANKFIYLFKNKFIALSIIFVVWILFFDENNIFYRFKLSDKLNDLKEQKQYFEKEIKNTQFEIDEIMGDPEKLVKFAREKYLMKKDNEDIFIIINKNQN